MKTNTTNNEEIIDRKVENQKLTLSIPEAAEQLRISANTMRQLARRKGFPAFNIGNRLLVSAKGLAEWVEEQAKNGVQI